MAVTVQGYLALDLVKKNNVELVKGVDRASTTTVAALRTAVTVAQALTNQKLVLEQITRSTRPPPNIIEFDRQAARSRRPRRSTNRPPRSTIPLETLQRAFQNIYDTMDAIDSFKLKALDSMKTTVDALATEVEKSKGYIARAEGAGAGRAEGAGGGHLQARGGVSRDRVDDEIAARAAGDGPRSQRRRETAPGRASARARERRSASG